MKATGPLDPTLRLWKVGANNSLTDDLGYNDDNPEGSVTLNSRFGRNLGPGSYAVEAKLANPSLAWSGHTLTLVIDSTEQVFHTGWHQADHTSAYRIGALPTFTPPAPPQSQTAPPNHLSELVPASVAVAVGAWNAVGSTGWPNILVCALPCDRNSGNSILTVNVVDEDKCDTSVACHGGRGPHLGDTNIYIEKDPIKKTTRQNFVWAHRQDLHWEEVSLTNTQPPTRYWYMPSAMMHEFGHDFGLDDLYGPGLNYPGYIMGGLAGEDRTSVPSTDVNYIKQVYRAHGGVPH